MPHVLEVNTIGELERLQLVWNALLGQTRCATYFHTLDWLRSQWTGGHHRSRLRVCVASSGGEPIGILPLVQRSEPTRLGSVRLLCYPLDARGVYYGPIGPHPTATLAAVMRHLAAQRDWDVVDLRGVAAEVDRGRTSLALRMAGLPGRQAMWGQTKRIELDWQLAGISGSQTSWLGNRSTTSLDERDARSLVYERYRPQGARFGDADPRCDLIDCCLHLDQHDDRPAGEEGTRSLKDTVGTMQQAHHAAARAGAVDVNLLHFEGRPIAYAYNYCRDGLLQVIHAAVDRQALPLDPASVLMARMLQDSLTRGDHAVDLTVDWPGRIDVWRPRTVTTHRCCHYSNSSARIQLLRLTRWTPPQRGQVA